MYTMPYKNPINYKQYHKPYESVAFDKKRKKKQKHFNISKD